MNYFKVGNKRIIEDSTCGGNITQTIIDRKTSKNGSIQITIEESWIACDSGKHCKHKIKHTVYRDFNNDCEVYAEWDPWYYKFISRSSLEFQE